MKLTPNTPSLTLEQRLSHLASAHAVARFVGDLYSWSGISGPLVKLCLDLVVYDLTWAEELDCILNVLQRCGASLCKEVLMDEYFQHIHDKATEIDRKSRRLYRLPPAKTEPYVVVCKVKCIDIACGH